MKFAISACVSAAVVGLAQADTFYLQASDAANKSAFLGTGAKWKSASGTVHDKPQPGHVYVIDGRELVPTKNNLEPRSNSGGATSFEGDALYLRDRDIALLSPNAAPFVCTNLIADAENGAVMSALENQCLQGRVTVPAGGAIAFWLVKDKLRIESDLYGAGQVNLRGQTVSAHYTLSLAGDNSHFTGRFATTGALGQKLVFETASSWFGNPSAFDADSVCLTNAVPVYFNSSLTAHTPNRGINVTPGEGLVMTYLAVAEGQTVVLDSPIKSSVGFGKAQPGALVLCGPSPELAGRIVVEAGTIGFGVSNAFGSAALEMSAGTTLRCASTNGPLVLAAAPTGTYNLEVPENLTASVDLLSLPEEAAFDQTKVVLMPEDGVTTLRTRTEGGRKIVFAHVEDVPEDVRRTYYLVGNDVNRGSSFAGTGAGWTNAIGQLHLKPKPGYRYVVDGYEPMTKKSGHTVFEGDELRLVSKNIALKATELGEDDVVARGHFICSNLVVTGTGSILNGCSLVETIEGKITVTNGAWLSFYNVSGFNRSIRVCSDLYGEGTVAVQNVDDKSYVAFCGDNSHFTGHVQTVGSSQRIRFMTPESWFGNPSEFDAASVQWTNCPSVYFYCSLATVTPNRGLDLTSVGSLGKMSMAVQSNETVRLDMPIRSSKGFGKYWPGTLVLAGVSPELSGIITVGEGALGGVSSNSFGAATLAMGEDAILRFCSTNGPYALAAAPTVMTNYVVEVEGFGYPTPFTPHVKVDLLRLPPGAAFDASKVTVRRAQPVRHELSAKLVVRRTDAEVLVSAIFRRKRGMTFMLK